MFSLAIFDGICLVWRYFLVVFVWFVDIFGGICLVWRYLFIHLFGLAIFFGWICLVRGFFLFGSVWFGDFFWLDVFGLAIFWLDLLGAGIFFGWMGLVWLGCGILDGFGLAGVRDPGKDLGKLLPDIWLAMGIVSSAAKLLAAIISPFPSVCQIKIRVK